MLSLCFLSVHYSGVTADGYWDIQLSPNSITSVPFGAGHISVWEHAVTKGRYYAMPLVYLLRNSTTIVDNILTGDVELEFEVLMWSVEAREAVFRHLKENVDQNVKIDQVEMLPMEKIRIVWRDRIRPISRFFKLVDHWKSNTHLPASVFFQFTCEDLPKCERLKTAMQTNPRIFSAIELEYIINGQKSSRRSLTVTGTHLLKGRLFTKMASQSPSNERYLQADDVKTIASESVSNVIASVVTDASYVDTGDEVGVKDILIAELKRQEVSTDNFQPHMWESVFWDPTWAKPDKLTRYLNKVIEKDTQDSRNFLLNESERVRSSEGGGSGSFMGISGSANAATSSTHKSKIQKEDLLNTLRERHRDIEWDGERFLVKPMKLYRLNLSQLNTSRNIASANIQVRRYETVQSIKVRLTNAGSELTPSLSPQLIEARLNEKLAEQKQQTESAIDTKTAANLQQINAVNGRVTSVEGRLTGVTNTANNVNSRMGAAEGRLRSLPGWPGGGFCFLARGGCPGGFGRQEMSIRAGAEGAIGDSRRFTVRSRDNQNYRTKLVACCK